jgi:2'-5' RNA ligase
VDASAAGARPIRSFVAIEVEEPARAAMLDYLALLRGRIDGVAWTRPENVHVTLKFLGDVVPERLVPLTERLTAIAGAQPPFIVTYGGVGGFPSGARPQVLWVGATAPELARLAAVVDEAGVIAGVERDRRPYHPHVTLGRVRDARSPRRDPVGRRPVGGMRPRDVLAADAERRFGAAGATALVLFRSDTGPTGARHTPLARVAFGYE